MLIADWLMSTVSSIYHQLSKLIPCSVVCVHVCVYGYVRFGPCNSAVYFSSGTFIDADFGTKSGSRGTEFKGKIL